MLAEAGVLVHTGLGCGLRFLSTRECSLAPTSNPCYLPFCLGLLSHSGHLSWNLISFFEPLLGGGVPSRVSPSLSPDKPHSQVQAGKLSLFLA